VFPVSPWFALLGAFCVLLAGCARTPPEPRRGPLSPEEALRGFKLHPDFQIEIFAAEPHVRDPVELVFDERGRMFVVEMLDYPDDPPKGQPPRGRIRMIEDTNGDGRVDKSTIFAERLLQAASVLPWRGGLLVGVAPDIIHLRDTNGDGRADYRRVLATGFALGNSEHRVTNLRYGLDNWIYAANGAQPGTITSPAWPEAPPVSVHGADFRFQPDRRRFEATAHVSQYGLTFDAYGNRFGTQNTVHVRHVVLPRHYVARNPYLPARSLVQDINRHGLDLFQLTGPQAWRVARTEWRQRRYNEQGLKRTEIVSGTITGASGGTIYDADLFPAAVRGNLFTGDVAGNLVHRDVLVPDGLTFRAERAADERDREFLASTDPWFRPCNFTVGPDGSLYVIDIHREFIETPESVPVPIRKSMNFYSGTEQGRIYRIRPRLAAGRSPLAAGPSTSLGATLSSSKGGRWPGAFGTEQLVTALEHANQWWRLTAQRLLVERRDPAAVGPLRQLARGGGHAVGRIHALWTLDGMDALTAADVDTALRDRDAHVREHAVRLAERFPTLAPSVARLAADDAIRVQFQTALTLGGFEGAGHLPTIARIVARHADNEWFRRAALASRWGASTSIFDALVADDQYFKEPTGGRASLLRDLGVAIGASDNAAELRRFTTRTRALRDDVWRSAAAAGIAEGSKIASLGRAPAPAAKDASRSASAVIDTVGGKADPRHGVLRLSGDARRGEPAFKKLCANCHHRGGGRLVGPDLVGVSNRTSEELLESIVAPSAAIVPDFARYIVDLKNGEVRDGLIIGETPGTITLRSADGDTTILRSRISSTRRSNISMMPEGLVAGMSDQELADLIAFLQAAHLQVSK